MNGTNGMNGTGVRGQRVVRLAAIATVLVACAEPPAGIVVGPVEFSAPAGSLAPALAAAGDAAVLSWLEPAGDGRFAFRTAVRRAGAWTPNDPVVVSDSLFVNWADVPSVQPGDDGVWLAHWLRRAGAGTYAYHVHLAVSPDEGRSWGAPFVPHADRSETEHGFAALVPWTDGWAALWLDGRNTVTNEPMTLRFAPIAPGGSSGQELEVDPKVCDCCQTAVARTASGLVAAYRDRSDGEIRDIASRRFEGGRWTEPRMVADDGWHYPGCPVNGPQLDARGDTVAVAWFTGANETPRVYVAFSTDAGRSWGPRLQVDDGRPAGRVDVAWWGDRALVSWIEETGETGEVRVRLVDASGRLTPGTTVARTAASRAAGFPRLVVVGDAAVVAWTQPGDSGGVRVAALAGGS
jgi:hypothetical protein